MDSKMILTIVIGIALGFILQRSGSSNPNVVINMLRLKSFHLMKALFLGLGLSSLALFLLIFTGVIDNSSFSIKTMYFGVIVGAGIFGLGWAISGFCPGSSIVALGVRRRDAFFFIIGGLLGAFLFVVAYDTLKQTALFDGLLKGKSTLANTGVEGFPALIPSFSALFVAGSIALVFIIIAFILPSEKSND